jgi:hypothetical protein
MTNEDQMFERVELEMKKHRPTPKCVDYDVHDKIWTRDKRAEWNQKSKEIIAKLNQKYKTKDSGDLPE